MMADAEVRRLAMAREALKRTREDLKRTTSKRKPSQVAAVHKAAKDSAKRGGLPKDTAHLYRQMTGYAPDITVKWQIVDNYERYSNAILEYDMGAAQWTIRRMYSEAAPQKISYQDALANAQLMFSDR
jgi:hypothetical protein